jgi:hypothetical protein
MADVTYYVALPFGAGANVCEIDEKGRPRARPVFPDDGRATDRRRDARPENRIGKLREQRSRGG